MCNLYRDPEYSSYLVQYRGNFIEEISKIDYACGFLITDKIAIVVIKESYEIFERLYKDVPSILLVELRTMYVLEDISAVDVCSINRIKKNQYLNLNGKDVLVGLVDTGIDYLNNEFWKEDDTTRIVSIWDQSISTVSNEEVYMGEIYSRDAINSAINAKLNGQDPYAIVPSIDEIGHGTAMAGIVGSRGYDEELQGIAENCEFVVVKLAESENFKKVLRMNGVTGVPVYNNSEILAAIEYLDRIRRREGKPMVILVGLGTTENSHDGNGVLSRFINERSAYNPLVVVTGVGNEGDKEGHVTGYISNVGESKIVELKVPRVMNTLNISIWVRRPNKMSLNVISPYGEESRIIKSKMGQFEEVEFIYENVYMSAQFLIPQGITGQEAIIVFFKDIKPGIWKFELVGDYIVDGRFDIWLAPKKTLPEEIKFLTPNPESTLTVPATAQEVISVAFYNSSNNSKVSESGKGFNINGLIKPNMAAPGVNIITTNAGGGKTVVSGSCVAASVVAGICALLFQWGIGYGNDKSMNATKLNSYIINGAIRDGNDNYPNNDWGYGRVDLEGVFNSISGFRSIKVEEYKEYYINSIFVRVHNSMISED